MCLVTLSILHTKDIYTTHFSTNDLSHVLSTGAINTLPVHIGWDLTYQAAYCALRLALVRICLTPLNGLSIVPCKAETYAAARCCAGTTPTCPSRRRPPRW